MKGTLALLISMSFLIGSCAPPAREREEAFLKAAGQHNDKMVRLECERKAVASNAGHR